MFKEDILKSLYTLKFSPVLINLKGRQYKIKQLLLENNCIYPHPSPFVTLLIISNASFISPIKKLAWGDNCTKELESDVFLDKLRCCLIQSQYFPLFANPFYCPKNERFVIIICITP